MELLRRNAGSVLWLRRFHKRVQENLIKHAKAAGVAAERVVFAGRMPDRAQHLARHRHADLFLDTPRFGGHSTLADVVWAAVPSIVLPSENMASRIGASILSAIGGALFVARDLEDYADMAHAWANPKQPTNRKRLHHFRQHINTTLRHPDSPFAAPAYTKRLEGIYALAWETFRARRQPKDAPIVLGGSALEALGRKAPPLVYTGDSVVPGGGGGGGGWGFLLGGNWASHLAHSSPL